MSMKTANYNQPQFSTHLLLTPPYYNAVSNLQSKSR